MNLQHEKTSNKAASRTATREDPAYTRHARECSSVYNAGNAEEGMGLFEKRGRAPEVRSRPTTQDDKGDLSWLT